MPDEQVARRILQARGDLAVDQGEGDVVGLLGEQQAASPDRQPATTEIDAAGRVLALEVQRADRGIGVEDERPDRGVPDVVVRARAVQRGAGVTKESGGVERTDAQGGVITGELTVDDGPRSDDAIGQRRRRGEEDTVVTSVGAA